MTREAGHYGPRLRIRDWRRVAEARQGDRIVSQRVLDLSCPCRTALPKPLYVFATARIRSYLLTLLDKVDRLPMC